MAARAAIYKAVNGDASILDYEVILDGGSHGGYGGGDIGYDREDAPTEESYSGAT